MLMLLSLLKNCLKVRGFSPVPGFGVPAFFVPDMVGGLRGGNLSGFGTPVVQYDLGGPDYPVMAPVPGVGVIEIPRFLLFAVPLPKIVQKCFVNLLRAIGLRGQGHPNRVQPHMREKL